MINRIRKAIRSWWYTGQRRAPRRSVFFIDLAQQTIPRKPVLGRPPWGPAPLPCFPPVPVAA